MSDGAYVTGAAVSEHFGRPLDMTRDRGMERNAGVSIDSAKYVREGAMADSDGVDMLAWVQSAQVNKPAVLRRAAALLPRRSVKSHQQAAFFVRAIQCIDLTTLDGADTETNVRRLCHKASRPLVRDLAEKLGVSAAAEADDDTPIVQTAAVCVYASRVADAVKALSEIPGGDKIQVASVATGFPAGQTPLPIRLAEIKYAVEQGATEIDIVLNRALVIAQDWRAVYDEVWQMREACGPAHLKTILAVGDLPTLREVYKASIVCMCAGADFIKTSTGKEGINATLANGLVMCRALREYHEKTGFRVGFKPAGGIRSAKDTLAWLGMMADECGEPWTHPNLFRFGASSLLGDLERQLEHGVSGKYSADRYVPMA